MDHTVHNLRGFILNYLLVNKNPRCQATSPYRDLSLLWDFKKQCSKSLWSSVGVLYVCCCMSLFYLVQLNAFNKPRKLVIHLFIPPYTHLNTDNPHRDDGFVIFTWKVRADRFLISFIRLLNILQNPICLDNYKTFEDLLLSKGLDAWMPQLCKAGASAEIGVQSKQIRFKE